MLCCIILRIFIRIHRGIDINLAVECATTVVVTTVNTCAIATYDSITTAPVDICLINVARIFVIQAISTTKDFIASEGRACRNIDHGTTGDTLLITTAIHSLEVSTEQVDGG